MRGFLASSVGVTCAAALALPLALSAPAQAAPQAVKTEPAAPGSTRSLPLVPLGDDRSLGAAAPEQGVTRRSVRSFSLVGVVWDDPGTELRGRVQVRTRASGTTHWTGWQDIETHNHEHGADPGSAESGSGRVRGSTAPLWVGASDGVEVRVQASVDERSTSAGEPPLPRGMHLELVDPGGASTAAGRTVGPGVGATAENAAAAAGATAAAYEASAANAALAPLGATEIPALSKARTEQEYRAAQPGAPRAKPYIGARPRIVTRRGWGANESLRERGFVYTKKVKAAFVHHTASGNNYRCSQAPSVIRSIYRYHVVSSGWRDIGYNFLVDKCGTVYEGRAGGVAKPVMGAHTLGFNSNTMGIAVLGTFADTRPAAAALNAVARLTAWKLGVYGVNPRGKTYLKSGGGNLYRKGKNVRLNVISGHRDGFATECPGRLLYGKLGSARTTAARYQGR
ncbi:peptidoglycan recognition protein [Streptomyces sp. NPDC001083]|uniref:peptidoglycan recognition protein family protein n=1 Tax=Streptomyces sp. NPDC001083 TaxID=3364545 RepID=UPI0036C69DA8